MRTLIVIIALFISHNSTSQVNARTMTSELYRADEYIRYRDNTMSYSLPKDYHGSPYFNDIFLPGNIYKGNELIAKDIPLRYNIFSNEIEVKESLEDGDEEAKPLTKSSEIFVKIDDTIIILIPFNGKDEDGSYFQVLFEGKKINLLKNVTKEFTKPKKASSSITRDLMGAFTDKTTFFLETKNGKLYELPRAKNKKFQVFGKDQEYLIEFATKNSLNINKEEDLKRLIAHYDSL